MAPDRGPPENLTPDIADEAVPAHLDDDHHGAQDEDRVRRTLAERASEPQNFTLRGVLCGLIIGLVIVSSNTYFGLQTGWVSGMAMPSALIGFAFFKVLAPYLNLPFSPVENVLIQTVAGSAGTMPLGCGFVGVVPALEYLLKPEENGPLHLDFWRLSVWAVGICLFGVVFAVPLRKETIIREKLRFPSGTATALLIGVLHGGNQEATIVKQNVARSSRSRSGEEDEYDALVPDQNRDDSPARPDLGHAEVSQARKTSSNLPNPASGGSSDWKSKIRLLTQAFAVSACYTILIYFIPKLRSLPVFGMSARTWLWTLNPSPAYVGQGIIMGPSTTAHMLLGAIIGWGILSPLAKHKHWAPGEVKDWTTGSKGWIVWVSLAIMLADALVSLGWLLLRPAYFYLRAYGPQYYRYLRGRHFDSPLPGRPMREGYQPLDTQATSSTHLLTSQDRSMSLAQNFKSPCNNPDEPEVDAPPEQLVSNRSVSVALYLASIYIAFPSMIPFSLTVLAFLLALLLSLMGVRALGETDLNPVSGISKLTQLVFAFLVPSSNPNAVTINLLAGAISESGALQAGDLMQDLKTGHLLGAAPNAQFYGQIIGSVIGAVASAGIYKMYTHVYTIGEGQFEVPTAFVWVFTARLVTGKGLPEMASTFAFGAGAICVVLTAIRIAGKGHVMINNLVPGGIAVAVGMYNTPSFTLARAVGGFIAWYWTKWRTREETSVVVLASGLILGEGLLSIVNLGMASLNVPHLRGW